LRRGRAGRQHALDRHRGPDQRGRAPTIPSAWAGAPVLACAVAGGPWAGLAGGLLVSAADVAERPVLLPGGTSNGIVLLLIAGGVGGYLVRLGLLAEEKIERAARQDAAASERERIARGIHDSVLQVLALVSSAKGLTYPQIATRLTLSTRTVQNHVRNTLTKLQLNNKAQLVRYALENGVD
jgi:DNA-binding CsgD family transcriptional regulator